uniref:Uncharacterized protein n=1 Tax=Setaria digitata TaxID=48799 RepID=A0A915PYV4_9BILA
MDLTDDGYRSKRELLLELQRVYDVAIYSVFGTIVFLIITNLISLAIRLKVTVESVDYITEQVNQQCKEYEETVRRYVRDAFLVRKYYETAFAPIETLSVEQTTLKQRQERTVAETVEEISKQLTTLDKMNAVVDAIEEKQLDTKFLKLIKELNKTGQVVDGKLAKRFRLIPSTGRELRLLSSMKAGQVLQDFKIAKTQSSSNRENKRISEVMDSVASVKMKSFSKSADTALEKSLANRKSVARSPAQHRGSPDNISMTSKDSCEADTVKSSAKVETESINALSELIEKLSVEDSSQSVDGIEANDEKENETKDSGEVVKK